MHGFGLALQTEALTAVLASIPLRADIFYLYKYLFLIWVYILVGLLTVLRRADKVVGFGCYHIHVMKQIDGLSSNQSPIVWKCLCNNGTFGGRFSSFQSLIIILCTYLRIPLLVWQWLIFEWPFSKQYANRLIRCNLCRANMHSLVFCVKIKS